ncbi:alpha/beta hydrolase [Candidatus Poriferisocius sp.]|uniref:alpha/beta hydrolase n=1 Tax=Candidatus Poriferisocius sp. TaxID=3101276 RepID=UPI003B020DD3
MKLAGHLALPENRRIRALPGVVLCPGFPSVANGGSRAATRIYPLADRIAQHMEWAALVPSYRGCGDSEGDFSLEGWIGDVRSAVGHLDGMEQVQGVWLAGFGIGGALAAHVAQDDPRVRGVATMGAPVDFTHWGLDASGVVSYARSLGIISTPGFPDSVESWAEAALSVRVDRCAAGISPRPMLVLHGSDDREVSPLDARVIADAHGEATLRIISGAGHSLHSDPRCIAILLGWLDSQITLIA